MNIFGMLKDTLFGDSGYDPSEEALAHYRELNDYSSPYWKQVTRFIQRSMSQGIPTIDTLTGFYKSQGVDTTGAQAIGTQQYKAQLAATREAGSQTLLQQMLGTEQYKLGYLGQAQQGYQYRDSNKLSLLNQLLTLGGGGLVRAFRGGGMTDYGNGGRIEDTGPELA